MIFEHQIIVILYIYILVFVFIRGFLYGVKRYQLNNSAYKKRKENETFKEWLLYSRYKQEIPKVLRILYFVVLIIHPVSLIACLLMYLIDLSLTVGWLIAVIIVVFDSLWVSAIALLFWSPGRSYALNRWIKKRRGQKPRK